MLNLGEKAMRMTSIVVVSLCVLLSMSVFAVAGEREGRKTGQIVTRKDVDRKVTYKSGLTAKTGYGTWPITGFARLDNHDMYLSYWNKPSEITFSIQKNDVWDRRYLYHNKKIVTLEDVKRVCFSKDFRYLRYNHTLGFPNAIGILYLVYDFPCPKPVGQVIIRCPDLAAADKYGAKRLQKALRIRAEKGDAKADLRVFIHSVKNVLAIKGRYSNLKHPLQIQLYRHKDTIQFGTSVSIMIGDNFPEAKNYDYSQDENNGPIAPPEAGTDGRFYWIRQRFHAEETFPKGFEYVMMGVVQGPSCHMTAKNNVSGAGAKAIIDPRALTKHIHHNKQEIKVTEMVNAASGSIATCTCEKTPDPSFTAYICVVTTRDSSNPFKAAKKQLQSALKQGFESLLAEHRSTDKETIRKWRATKVFKHGACRTTYADATGWHGDYHFNEGKDKTQLIIRGQWQECEQWLRLLEEFLPAAKLNARKVYGYRGAYYPLIAYPIKSKAPFFGVEVTLEITAYILKPFWQIYQYTGDVKFLQDRAYPLLREAARFYADYVTLGDDGFYHAIPSISQENRGLSRNFRFNRDAVGALSFIKYHLNACAQASEILGVDAGERKKWRDIANRMAPYPTYETKEGTIFTDVRGAPLLPKYNLPSNQFMVCWTNDIHLDSPPEQLTIARRTYRLTNCTRYRSHSEYGATIVRRLGIVENTDLSPEGMLMSCTGRVHLFAGVPKGKAVSAQFNNYLAIGAFEFSAKHRGTKVTDVRMKSRSGNICKIKNPWHPKAVEIRDTTTRTVVKHNMRDDTIVFPTEKQHKYIIAPLEENLT